MVGASTGRSEIARLARLLASQRATWLARVSSTMTQPDGQAVIRPLNAAAPRQTAVALTTRTS